MQLKKVFRTHFKGKKVLIMGLGLHGGGAGTVRFFAKTGAVVTVTDLRRRSLLHQPIAELSHLKHVRYVLGRHRKKDFEHADYIVKNPGIPPYSPWLLAAQRKQIPIISDIGIFFMYCPAQIIGVTGTRGKSTAAYLIWKFLSSTKKHVYLGGNIRKSVLDFMHRLTKNDIVVLELSSFQLKDMAYVRRSPQVSVLTNIFPDHLNWHGTIKNYRNAKKNIFKFQKPHDYLFVGASDLSARALARITPSRVRYPTLPLILRPVVDVHVGRHYRDTIALAYAVGKHFRVPAHRMKKIIRAFRGLEGRQEILPARRGIHFVNDTTATIPDASIAAIRRFKTYAGRNQLILIAGGSDKGLRYEEMASAIKKDVDALILLPGDATDKIKSQVKNLKIPSSKICEVSTMRKAVIRARRIAKKGDWVLLSPGAASFGLFANEFDRGTQFVKALKTYGSNHR